MPNILRADNRKQGGGLSKAASNMNKTTIPHSHRSVGTARSAQPDAGSSPQDTARSGDKAGLAGRSAAQQKSGTCSAARPARFIRPFGYNWRRLQCAALTCHLLVPGPAAGISRVDSGEGVGVAARLSSPDGTGGPSGPELVRRMSTLAADLSGVARPQRLESSMTLHELATAIIDEYTASPDEAMAGDCLGTMDRVDSPTGGLVTSLKSPGGMDPSQEGSEAATTAADSLISSRHGKMTHASPRRVVNAAAFVIGHMAAYSTGNPRRRKKEPAGGDPFEGLECAKTLGTGSWLCEMALVHEGRHESTVICHKEATLLALDQQRLHQVVGRLRVGF